MPLDFVVPDLLLAPSAPAAMRELRLPWVEKWVARSEVQRLPLRGLESWLARAFGLADPPPVAAVSLAGEERRPADDELRGTWLRADPVHLRIAGDALTLHDAAALELWRDEAEALVAALADHFAVDGLRFIAAAPHRWYVRVPEGEVPKTTPLDDALGRNIFGLLPEGGGRINWGGAITEAQMVLSAHPANAAREASGKPPINSVWFWGGGETPAALSSPYALAHADEVFTRGLARLSGTREVAAVRGFDKVDAVRAEEWVLVVDDRLSQAMRSAREDAWISAARTLDEEWFAHLGEAAERFDGVRLVLPGPRDTFVATISPRARWRWLRTRKPLSTHA